MTKNYTVMEKRKIYKFSFDNGRHAICCVWQVATFPIWKEALNKEAQRNLAC